MTPTTPLPELVEGPYLCLNHRACQKGRPFDKLREKAVLAVTSQGTQA